MAATDLRPFTVAVPEADLVDLRERLARTRWPEPATTPGWEQGVPLDVVRDVCAHWATAYDWRRLESRLNALDQRIVTIGGLDVHLLHARSPEPGARPLILTHGWPGSVVEFLDVLGPLTDPVAHGGDAADAFHVVCPSLPGYGFSERPSGPGWSVERIAAAWVELMGALGYDRFLAGGGDWGSFVTHALGVHHPDHVAGVHVTLGVCRVKALLALGEPTAEEQAQLARLRAYAADEDGYARIQASRPQTLGYGLTDSPAGQCAWILEKFGAWTDGDGRPEDTIDRDTLLDNVSLYWLTATAASSARLYRESFGGGATSALPLRVPVGYTVFPADLFAYSERWARTRYPDLRHYAVAPRGGHFASLEQPGIFVDEVRTALRTMR
ncbi:epoxide hydrolase family protein [Patulibacter sp. NPDC049589]|uniref:epoxide hydrolase family protein n=1 Tax=Patulibacter sp. NPDC049589 TaxID=3154731 RepID=UPI003437C8F2